ncbi:glycoside hydrolase family 99-like domain-containing protein [Luteimonas sp. SDU101]|uniref:glycoside hydrolase family 99-like domain-containing protein n=1 Tax=unclassified Luteimonas TaxID=2629088 RepID=UPI003EBEA441
MPRKLLVSLPRRAAFRLLRGLFRLLPLGAGSRDRLRQWFLHRLGFLVPEPPRGRLPNAWGQERRQRWVAGSRAIGYRDASAPTLPSPLPARLVAFYLPQFHPIPENDAAWGEGFTEWRNVNRAVPQFDGHGQPRLSGELGDYDLRDRDVMHRQVELARRYGVSAFAFYFYWFKGRSPLEAPLRNWLSDPTLDLSFCLCWANESWTRRWDGRDNEVILGQQHSPQDDLDFIRHVARYLADPRYLRVDGKPVLMVYRPSLFPDIRATAARWRDECRLLGIGELHLCYVQGFERPDPRDIGFDAAVEFPPNLTEPVDITGRQRLLVPDFAGKVLDWRELAGHALRKEVPDYPLYPAVNPGWDNEPRRPGRGRILIHASPRRYRDWLAGTIRRARQHGENDLVFINAWNEWAEGAVLEPDRRLGHAWLHATSQALQPASAPSMHSCKPAAIVHAWYEEEFADILQRLDRTGIAWRLVVTTAPEREAAIRAVLAHSGMQGEIEVHENRGRDILPFLRVADRLLDEGVQIALKLHTKRSIHRGDGGRWRLEMLDRLTAPARATRIMEAFEAAPTLGAVAPEGHVVPMKTYLSANRDAIEYLVTRLGLGDRRYLQHSFIAGSMFWCRLDALRPLLDGHLEEWEFESEAGQLDGTFAHAIERVIALCVRDAGYSVQTAATVAGKAGPGGHGAGPYPYAAPSHR